VNSQNHKTLVSIVPLQLNTFLYSAMVLLILGSILKVLGGDQAPYSVSFSTLFSSQSSWADTITNIGILLIMGIPVFRVACVGAVWAREKNMKFAIISAGMLLAWFALFIFV